MTDQNDKTNIYESFVFDCDCSTSPGIIIENNKIYCRWCKKELIKGGSIICNPNTFTTLKGNQ
jgi:hypothetical protein